MLWRRRTVPNWISLHGQDNLSYRGRAVWGVPAAGPTSRPKGIGHTDIGHRWRQTSRLHVSTGRSESISWTACHPSLFGAQRYVQDTTSGNPPCQLLWKCQDYVSNGCHIRGTCRGETAPGRSPSWIGANEYSVSERYPRWNYDRNSCGSLDFGSACRTCIFFQHWNKWFDPIYDSCGPSQRACPLSLW